VFYVCTLVGSSFSLVYAISVKTEKKLTHGELHGTASVRMPLLVSFPLHEKLLISANHFFFFGDALIEASLKKIAN
jgi:hypothetical protein